MRREPISAKGIDVRIKPRDPYSVELKFIHKLDPDRDRYPRKRTIRTRIAFFLPYSFGIRPDNFDPEGFFDEIKLYLRFNTPKMSIDELVDRGNSRSPITRLLASLSGDSTLLTTREEYEARILGAIVKTALRDTTTPLVAEEQQARQPDIDRLADQIVGLNEGLADLRAFLRPESERLPKLRFVDEYISLTVEDYLTRILAHTDQSLNSARLRNALVAESRYRAEMGYPSKVAVDDPPQAAEEYLYRSKLLKRYVSAVLFFEIDRGNQAKRVEQILAALAAGIAMAIATGISFIGQIRFGSLSVTLFLILVGAYMIKDRLKDIMRSLFHRTLGRLFFDRRTKFADPLKENTLGVVKERTTFLRPWQVDEDLERTRAIGGFEKAIVETNPESILEYTKRVTLRERRLGVTHRRLTGMADINIFDLKDLLRHIAKQDELVPMQDGEDLTVVERSRIYHLNMVISSTDTGETAWQKIRLIVDADGIRRIERPSSGGGT